MSEFPCNRCGACCRQVNRASETVYLDRGDGTCRHYEDFDDGGCSIYDERPEVCRVDRQYEIRYAKLFSWREFIQLNMEACEVIRKNVDDKQRFALKEKRA